MIEINVSLSADVKNGEDDFTVEFSDLMIIRNNHNSEHSWLEIPKDLFHEVSHTVAELYEAATSIQERRPGTTIKIDDKSTLGEYYALVNLCLSSSQSVLQIETTTMQYDTFKEIYAAVDEMKKIQNNLRGE